MSTSTAGGEGATNRTMPRVAALERLARIREGLGETAYKILLMAAVEDRTLCDVAKQLGGIDPRTARAWVVTAIRGLAGI
jgi:hypothetical protein